MDWYVDGDLVFLPKCIKVCLLDGRVEVINCLQWNHDKLPKPIRAYDGLSGGFIIS